MQTTPTPGSFAGRRVDKAGDPLDGLINLFDLSLVLAVGLLLAALSSIGATGLIAPQGSAGTPLDGQPPTAGQQAQGQGQEVGKVYRLSDGRYVFAPAPGSTTGGQTGGGATGATGSATTPPPGGSPGGATGSTPGAVAPGGTNNQVPPAGGGASPSVPGITP